MTAKEGSLATEDRTLPDMEEQLADGHCCVAGCVPGRMS